MGEFHLHAPFEPTGDQPEAIAKLVEGFREGNQFETLLGVTGSGKTFTMANIIQALQRPTLIISHNKTLAAQLYGEMKEFFPDNAVEYFVSYYDYYSPRHTFRPRTLISRRTRTSIWRLTGCAILRRRLLRSAGMLSLWLRFRVSTDSAAPSITRT